MENKVRPKYYMMGSEYDYIIRERNTTAYSEGLLSPRLKIKNVD
jgi:hypothetical protein